MTDLWFNLARAAVVVNVGLLLVLVGVWGSNYRRHGAAHTFGLLVFGLFLLAENLLGTYLYTLHPVFHGWVYEAAPVAQQGMMALNVLETVALLLLVRVTWS